MRLAISNIAWLPSDDDIVAPRLVAAGANGLEVAPARVHPNPQHADSCAAAAIRRHWESRGLPILAMQSLLFGVGGAELFGSDEARERMTDALIKTISFAAALGCKPLVFGSPKNRLKGELSSEEAVNKAIPFFRHIGDHSRSVGCTFCVEANAPGYGCDFITTLEEAIDLVEAVNHPNVGLVLDTGNMEMSGDGIERLLRAAALVRHLHLSRPRLAALDDKAIFARQILEELLGRGYQGDATIEMRAPESGLSGTDLACLAVECVRGWMGG